MFKISWHNIIIIALFWHWLFTHYHTIATDIRLSFYKVITILYCLFTWLLRIRYTGHIIAAKSSFRHRWHPPILKELINRMLWEFRTVQVKRIYMFRDSNMQIFMDARCQTKMKLLDCMPPPPHPLLFVNTKFRIGYPPPYSEPVDELNDRRYFFSAFRVITDNSLA